MDEPDQIHVPLNHGLVSIFFFQDRYDVCHPLGKNVRSQRTPVCANVPVLLVISLRQLWQRGLKATPLTISSLTFALWPLVETSTGTTISVCSCFYVYVRLNFLSFHVSQIMCPYLLTLLMGYWQLFFSPLQFPISAAIFMTLRNLKGFL